MKTLIVIDMQNDFVTGSLGTNEAQHIVPNVKKKLEEYYERGDQVFFTRDTHSKNYLQTLEGKKLPVEHCIEGTKGWEIVSDLPMDKDAMIINKTSFGFSGWHLYSLGNEIEIIGLCTDICVISNALILKAKFPDSEIYVDASCCAGTTPELHSKALDVMKSCQVNVIGE